jgi:alpha-glucosidase
MRKKRESLGLLLVVCFLFGWGNVNAKTPELQSPGGQLKVSFDISDKIYYNVSYGNDLLLDRCYLQLEINGKTLGKNPQLSGYKESTVNETLKPVAPVKFSSVKNHYNRLVLNFKENYAVEFRAFDDGIACRFITNQKEEAIVNGENFSLSLPGDYVLHFQQPGGFKTAYEELYFHSKLKEWKPGNMAVLPLLIDTKKQYKILVSESDLSDYPCLFLKKTAQGLTSTFPKVPLEVADEGDRSQKILKEADYIAKTSGKRNYPWRYLVITNDDKQLLENTMTLKLSSPNRLPDVSDWLKPGQASWEWWNGAVPYGPDVNFVSGCNLETYKYYIDFASRYGINYIVMDEGWAKTTLDPYTPNPDVDLHEIIRYGKEKEVGIVLWLTWLTVENHFELFKTFKDWGVKGMKIDFMDRSDQWMVNYYERVVKEAAKYQLFVDFHGAFKPAGLEYKYPNLISYEGVRGMEQMKGCFPDNSLYLPFIRNAVGPMDYTPGAMIGMQPDVYCSERPNSASIGTRSYQMALFVVFESAIQMLADSPTLYYRNEECTEFITSVPTTWDETLALEAKAGEYVIVAKQKGEEWFIGGITNNKEKERNFEIDFSVLTDGKDYRITWFEDGVNAGRQAMDYRKKTGQVKSGEKMKIKMVRNGGWTAVIK